MRCKGCNKILDSGKDMATNENTGDAEDLCSVCRSDVWDTGVVYEDGSRWNYHNKGKVQKFLNEAEFEPNYIGGAGTDMSTAFGIAKNIMDNGIICIEEP